MPRKTILRPPKPPRPPSATIPFKRGRGRRVPSAEEVAAMGERAAQTRIKNLRRQLGE